MREQLLIYSVLHQLHYCVLAQGGGDMDRKLFTVPNHIHPDRLIGVVSNGLNETLEVSLLDE